MNTQFIKKAATFIVLTGILAFIYQYLIEKLDEMKVEYNQKHNFKNHKIITISKDTITGNFQLQEEGGTLYSKGDSYYLDLKDSTKYYTKNVISCSPIKEVTKK